MEYSDVQSIMNIHGLNGEPAFENVNISIAPIDCDVGPCPLGLYYPDTELIVIPPGQSLTVGEGVLLHELGHRYGHFYYGDLSEKFAEVYRVGHQKKAIACMYAGDNLAKLPAMTSIFEEGERGVVEIVLGRELNQGELDAIRHQLYIQSQGERPPQVSYTPGQYPTLVMNFTKGVDWPVLIGATLAGVVVLEVGILAYAVYKISADMPWVVPVVIFGGITFFLLRAALKNASVRSTVREYVGR